MERFLLIFSIFLLISGFTSADDDICNHLQTLNAFKSKILLSFKEKKYHIKEIYNGNGAGKLTVSEDDSILDFYYKTIEGDDKINTVTYDRKKMKCTKAKEIKKSENIDFTEKKPYTFFNTESGIFGPSGMWSWIKSHTKFNLENNTENFIDRGIEARKCKGEIAEFTIDVTIPDPEWLIYDQKNKNEPELIKIEIKKKDSKEILTVDYLLFERMLEDEDQNLDDFWMSPSICDSITNETANNFVSKSMQMFIEELDKTKDMKRINLLLDKENDLIAIENLKKFDIYDRRNKINFQIHKDLFCKHSYSQKVIGLNEDLLNLLEDLIQNQAQDYYLVGKETVRNEITNVYRKKIKTRKQTQVNTLYLQERQSDLNKDYLTHDPVQIKIEKYNKNDDFSYTLNSSNLFSIYNFKNIPKDSFRILDLSECIDKSMIKEFYLSSRGYKSLREISDEEKVNPNNELIQEEAEEEIEKKLRELLVEISGQRLINFPKILVKITPKEIISRIKFLDFVTPLDYFSKLVNPLQKEEPDNLVKSLLECAIKSLKDENSTGFQHCSGNDKFKNGHYCDILKTNDFKVAEKDEKYCKTVEKNKDAMEKEFVYETTDEKFKRITDAVNEKKLSINFTRLEAEYIFDILHNVKEQSNIDRSKLYEIKFPHQKITENFYEKKVEIDNKVTGVSNCYEECLNPKYNFSCDSFAFCSKSSDEKSDCYLSKLIKISKDDKKILENDKNCNVYSVNYLKHFQEHSEKKLKNENFLKKYDETNGMDCAEKCLDYNRRNPTKDHCLSIEICENTNAKTTCGLSNAPTLWENEKNLLDDSNCTVYSVKHILNFHLTSLLNLENFKSEVVNSLDHCATLCDSADDCDTFNYCQTDSKNECRYLTKNGQENKTDFESDNIGCATYIHKKHLIVPISIKIVTENINVFTGNGFRVSSVVGFVFLFLAIGLLVGSVAFYRKKIYLEKRENESGKRIASVNFSNLRDDI